MPSQRPSPCVSWGHIDPRPPQPPPMLSVCSQIHVCLLCCSRRHWCNTLPILRPISRLPTVGWGGKQWGCSTVGM
jgi:hypothetical protein